LSLRRRAASLAVSSLGWGVGGAPYPSAKRRDSERGWPSEGGEGRRRKEGGEEGKEGKGKGRGGGGAEKRGVVVIVIVLVVKL
jgi:hypothetical protein